jgi:ribosomal protein S27AE
MRLTIGEVGDDTGILYLLEMEIAGVTFLKIGLTRRDGIEKRVCEITTSFFKTYRYFPYVRPKRFQKVEQLLEKEQMLLAYLDEYTLDTGLKFGGSTELRLLDLDIVVELYGRVVAGEKLVEEEWEKCPVCGKDKRFTAEERSTCGHKCEIE